MFIDRRAVLAGATAASLLAPIAPARAIVPERYRDPVRQLMAMTWIGLSKTKAEAFSGGDRRAPLAREGRRDDGFSLPGAPLR